jgi:4-amino-4-deoxy-L-arabinose transferase-like glycosyltransferase
MVAVALVVRLLFIVVAKSYQIVAIDRLGFVNEMERLGYSLAIGHGFRAPFITDAGPSAWTPPVYPWLISLTFRTFGNYSYAAGFAMLAFNSVFSALTSWTMYRIARRTFNQSVAVWSGWFWALFPYSIYWAVEWIWETSLSAFLLSLLFMLTLEMEDDDRLRSWFVYGLLWGIAGLTNTALLAWLPFSGLWLLAGLRRRGKRFLRAVVYGAVIFWITLVPWLWRNYSVFDQPVFLRDNFGNELDIGNNPLSQGWMTPQYDIANSPRLWNLYLELGEAGVNAVQLQEAKKWIFEHPKRFLVLTCRRFVYFWAGIPHQGLKQIANLLFLCSALLAFGGLFLALKWRVQGAVLYLTLLLSYPVVYYITFTEPRYRHPIDPELAILAVFLLWSAIEAKRRRPSGLTVL